MSTFKELVVKSIRLYHIEDSGTFTQFIYICACICAYIRMGFYKCLYIYTHKHT